MLPAGFDPAFFMNKRLYCIFNLISKNSIGVLDVGTDHGFIPIALAEDNFSGNIIATDINSLPLSRAVMLAEKRGVCDRICFQVFDGLNTAYKDMVDTIVIAGMGGDLICSIIDHGDWILDHSYSLILQPMSKPEVLRYYLINNGFTIRAENRIMEKNRIYTIIDCFFSDKNSSSYSTLDLYLGKTPHGEESALYLDQLNTLLAECRKIIGGRNREYTPEIRFYRDLEKQIVHMQSTYWEKEHVSEE